MCVVGIVGTALRLSHFSTPQSSVWRVFVFVDIWCCSVCTLAHRNTHTECTGLIQHGGVTQHWVWYSSHSRLGDTYPLESTGLLLVGLWWCACCQTASDQKGDSGKGPTRLTRAECTSRICSVGTAFLDSPEIAEKCFSCNLLSVCRSFTSCLMEASVSNWMSGWIPGNDLLGTFLLIISFHRTFFGCVTAGLTCCGKLPG